MRVQVKLSLVSFPACRPTNQANIQPSNCQSLHVPEEYPRISELVENSPGALQQRTDVSRDLLRNVNSGSRENENAGVMAAAREPKIHLTQTLVNVCTGGGTA